MRLVTPTYSLLAIAYVTAVLIQNMLILARGRFPQHGNNEGSFQKLHRKLNSTFTAYHAFSDDWLIRVITVGDNNRLNKVIFVSNM